MGILSTRKNKGFAVSVISTKSIQDSDPLCPEEMWNTSNCCDRAFWIESQHGYKAWWGNVFFWDSECHFYDSCYSHHLWNTTPDGGILDSWRALRLSLRGEMDPDSSAFAPVIPFPKLPKIPKLKVIQIQQKNIDPNTFVSGLTRYRHQTGADAIYVPGVRFGLSSRKLIQDDNYDQTLSCYRSYAGQP